MNGILTRTVSTADMLEGSPIQDVEQVELTAVTIAGTILELCNEHAAMQSYLPSHRAASAVTAARLSMQLLPSWSPLLEAISGLKYEDVADCLAEMLQVCNDECPPPETEAATPVAAVTSTPVASKEQRSLSTDSGFWSPPQVSPSCHGASWSPLSVASLESADWSPLPLARNISFSSSSLEEALAYDFLQQCRTIPAGFSC